MVILVVEGGGEGVFKIVSVGPYRMWDIGIEIRVLCFHLGPSISMKGN